MWTDSDGVSYEETSSREADSIQTGEGSRITLWPEGFITYAMGNAMISVSIKNGRLRMLVPVHLNGNIQSNRGIYMISRRHVVVRRFIVSAQFGLKAPALAVVKHPPLRLDLAQAAAFASHS